MKYLVCILSVVLLAACSGGGGSSSASSALGGISGVVSAGPINGATVTVYVLTSNGSQGTQIATTTSDSSGKYTLSLAAQTTPVELVVSGGSYTEEASGASVGMGSAQLRTLLPSTSAGQQVGVTPVTEIAAQNAIAAIGANGSTSVAAIISSSNASVASAMGLTDITLPPANPSQAASSAVNTQAAQYAVVLATISQMANTATISAGTTTVNSLDMMVALATSFTYNGSFSGLVNGNPVPVPNSAGATLNLGTVLTDVAGGGATFSTAMQSAMNSYVTSTAATNLGYDNSTLVPTTTFVTAPPPPTGLATLAPPAPPVSLPTTQPTVAGPTNLPGSPMISYGSALVLTKNTGMTAATPTSTGTIVSSCSVNPSLPTGLSLSSTCAISGTPTVVAATATYTLTATDPASATGSATISITVNDAAPTSLGYSSPTAAYQIGTTITPNTPSNSGGAITSYSISASLPAGLNFNTTTGAITGNPSVYSAATGYLITGLNITGLTTVTVTISSHSAPPPDVTGLTLVGQSSTAAFLSWTSGGGTTSGYQIAYVTGATPPPDCATGTVVAGSSISGTSTFVGALTTGTQYAFRLCALNGDPTPYFSAGVTGTVTIPAPAYHLMICTVTGILDFNFATGTTVQVSSSPCFEIDASSTFFVYGNGSYQLWELNYNSVGNGTMVIGNVGYDYLFPKLSSDGSKVAYAKVGGSAQHEMAAYDLVGLSETTLIAGTRSPIGWSDATTVVAIDGGGLGIETVQSDGTGTTYIYSGASGHYGNGLALANISGTPTLAFALQDNQLTRMNADGTNLTALLTVTTIADYPSFFPDGSIAYCDGNDIHVTNFSGSSDALLVSNANAPLVAPDGSAVALQSGSSGVNQIYTVLPDGTGVTQVTSSPTALYEQIVWSKSQY